MHKLTIQALLQLSLLLSLHHLGDYACRGTGVTTTSVVSSLLSGAAGLLIGSTDIAPSAYDTYSNYYDKLNGGQYTKFLGIDDMRYKTGTYVFGDVLEVAAGTGLQSDYYPWEQIKTYTAVDSSKGMLDELKARVSKNSRARTTDVKFLTADAGNLPLAVSDSYDTVVDTFSMCVFDEPRNVLLEMARSVKPISGRVVLLENSRSTLPFLGWWQDITEPVITPYSKGCKWNVDVPSLAAGAGLRRQESESSSIQLGTIYLGVYSKE